MKNLLQTLIVAGRTIRGTFVPPAVIRMLRRQISDLCWENIDQLDQVWRTTGSELDALLTRSEQSDHQKPLSLSESLPIISLRDDLENIRYALGAALILNSKNLSNKDDVYEQSFMRLDAFFESLNRFLKKNDPRFAIFADKALGEITDPLPSMFLGIEQ